MKSTGTIFTKFHPHPLHQHHQQQQQQQQPPPAPPPQSLQQKDPPQETSADTGSPQSSDAAKRARGGDGSSIEVARRPRGRPPGSKNKPKPPVVITRDAPDSPNVMRPHILEIPPGHDVADALHRFSRRRDLGLSVLAGTGAVSNVTLRHQQPHASSSPSTSFTFPGRFEILSISATILPPSFTPPSAAAGSFSVSLAGPHGQIVGGSVAGPLVAAGTVTVVAAAFSSPSFHRLPADDDVAVSVSVSGDGDQPQTTHSIPPQQQQQQISGALPISSCHLLSDVIWAPAARAPPHPPPY